MRGRFYPLCTSILVIVTYVTAHRLRNKRKDQSPLNECLDGDPQCQVWAEKGLCGSIPQHVSCKRSCDKNCAKLDNIFGPIPLDQCVDSSSRCQAWAARAECRLNRQFMVEKCTKSCGLCGENKCRDFSIFCQYWAGIGLCQKNPLYTKAKCRRSCGVCSSHRATPSPSTTQPSTPPTDDANCGVRYVAGSTSSPGSIALESAAAADVEATPHSFPWQAQITSKRGSHVCSGSLIKPQWVLTAARCFDGSPREYKIKLGKHDLDEEEKKHEQTYSVKKVILHKDYNSGTLDNDIALIQMNEPAVVTRSVGIVCLPKQGVRVAEGTKVVMSGWGRLGPSSSPITKLREATLQIADQDECRLATHDTGTVTDAMVCGEFNESSTLEHCLGDSGGPLVYVNPSTNRWTLQGVVSWGSFFCGSGRKGYAVMTSVDRFVSWISSNTKE